VKFDEDGQPVFIHEEGKKPRVEFLEPYSATHPEYLAAVEKFDEKDAGIKFRPLSLEMLADVKLSAAEIDVLGPILTEKPFLQAVAQKYD
jgi:hypothetical protein